MNIPIYSFLLLYRVLSLHQPLRVSITASLHHHAAPLKKGEVSVSVNNLVDCTGGGGGREGA